MYNNNRNIKINKIVSTVRLHRRKTAFVNIQVQIQSRNVTDEHTFKLHLLLS